MDQERQYSIGEVSEMLGWPSSTIRFYDKKGLLPSVARSEGGMRRFTQADINWLRMIEAMKMMGMSLAEMRELMLLHQQGNETIEDRRRMVHEKSNEILEQAEEVQRRLDLVTFACQVLDTAAQAGTIDVLGELNEEEIPPEVKRIAEVAKSLQAIKEAHEHYEDMPA